MALNQWTLNPINFNIKSLDNHGEEENNENELVCLRIARFSKVPKIDFQKVKINKSKTMKFKVFNPNSYSTLVHFQNVNSNDFLLDIPANMQNTPPSQQSDTNDCIPLNLEPDQVRQVSVTWSPTIPGNTREVLTVKWDGGLKLQVIFLGNCIGEITKKSNLRSTRKNSKNCPETLSKKINSSTLESRKALSTIQPDTPSRRTTFLVSKPPTNHQNENEKSNSPLSFSKSKNNQACKKLPIRKTKTSSSNKENERRQTFNVSKVDTTSRNLFGNTTNKGRTSSKASESENAPTKPKSFLKRTSVSQTLPKPNIHKGLAMKKLKLVKEANKAMPRHPMPFAAKNMFYDERWIDKQERGFTNWLNYILTPFVEENCENDVPDRRETYTIDAQKKQEVAPTKEDLSFRAYSMRRRMAQLRRSACRCYQSEDFTFIIHKIEKEVECGLIAVRQEKHILADLGIKNHIMKLLLSFNSLWLRIGLEVIFGEMILLHSNSDVQNLSRFITARLLANPDIAAMYAHPTVPNYFKPGYEEALCKFALKKFLLLVSFLDHAKRKRLIDHDPCLFNVESQIKATRDILLNFSKEFLKGEGDITKHLSYMGITIAHTQTALDEYDFGIKNIATDLRDGVRIARVVELLTKNWVLSSKLRMPAISRLQKVHNVNVALECLKTNGLKLMQDAKCVVDGHREKTLMLLWQVIFHFQVGMLLEVDKLREEVDYLSKRLKLHHQTIALSTCNDLGLDRRDSLDKADSMYFKSDKLSLLLRWCKSVCAHYDVKIENFTVSFSDGIALCCLVNFYHPDMLPRSLINNETTQTCSVAQQDDGDVEDDFFYDNWTKCFSPNTGVNRRLETLLSNEKENYRVLNQAVHELGGIPTMLRSADMSNTIPDEKVVITYVSYLCSRLLSIQKETRAARTIQLAWRKHKLGKMRDVYQVQHKAASIIQACYRSYITRMHYLVDRECVIICQSVVRRWLTLHHLEIMDAAAYVIQCVFRDYLETSRLRYNFLQMRSSAVVIQRAYRVHLQKCFTKHINAALVIQQAWRSYNERQHRHQWIEHVNQSAMVIQSAYRKYSERKELIEMLNYSALTIQNAWRSYSERKQWIETVNYSALVIQNVWRGYRERKQWNELVNYSALVIQNAWKGYQQHKMYLGRCNNAAVVVQHFYRSSMVARQQRLSYLKILESTCLVQTWWRNCMMRQREKSVIKIQAWYRMTIAQKRYVKMVESYLTIQQFWKNVMVTRTTRQDYLMKVSSAIVLQSHVREWLSRKELRSQQEAASTIQTCWRAHQAGKQQLMRYQEILGASVVIQSQVRGLIVRQQFLKTRKSVVFIQNHWRASREAKRVHDEFLTIKSSCIQLQSAFRMWSTRKQFMAKRDSATVIQHAYRCHVTRRQERLVKRTQNSIVRVQSLVRCFVARSRFNRQKNGAVKIQQRWRSYRLMCEQLDLYKSTKDSVILLQSLFRMKRCKQEYLTAKSSAILIQSTVRMYIASKRFNNLKQSTVKIQCWYRTAVAELTYKEKCIQSCILIQSCYRMHLQRNQFQNTKRAVTQIQSLCRMMIERNYYVSLRKSAIKIQSATKGYLQRKEFTKMHQNTVLIQSVFRTYLAKRELAKKRSAVVKIQSCVRGYHARRSFAAQREAVVCIQSNYRTHVVRSQYVRQRKSVIILQSFQRMRVERSCYLSKKRATIKLQSVWLSHVARRDFVQQRSSALKIQATYRMYQTRSCYVKTLKSIRTLQACVRMQQCRRSYVLMTQSAVCIQSNWRMRTTHAQFTTMKRSAVTIQSNWRRYREEQKHREVTKQHKAVVCLQSATRMWLQRSSFVKERTATMVIQRCWRNWRQQKQFEDSLSLVQSFVRMSIQRIKYLRSKQSAIMIQAATRSYLQRKQYLQLKRSVIHLQSIRRTILAKKHFSIVKSSALQIQSTWRMHVERKQYQCCRQSAIKIQSVWRRHQEECRYKVMLEEETAALKIQSFYRMIRERDVYRKELSDIVVVQSLAKMQSSRCVFLKKRAAAIKIQTCWRCYQCRRLFERQQKAALCIQSLIRGRSERKRLAAEREVIMLAEIELKKNVAAVSIQSFVKMSLQRHRYRTQRDSAIRIQSFVRMIHQRRQYHEEQTRNSAAISIQSFFKMTKQRRQYQLQRDACIAIQRTYRAFAIGYPCYLKYHVTRGAIITIQALIRGSMVRKSIIEKRKTIIYMQACIRRTQARQRYLKMRSAALVLQKNARRNHAVRQYHQKRSSAVLIQSHFRRILATRECRELMKQKRDNAAARCIQLFFKLVIARKLRQRLQQQRNLKRREDAAIVIQRYWMNYRSNVQRKDVAARTIQAWQRATVAKKRDWTWYHVTRGKIITVQACYRGYRERKQYSETKEAVSKIQQWWRNVRLSSQLRRSFLEKCKSCLTIQRTYRGFAVRKCMTVQRHAAVTIQVAYRMYTARRDLRVQQMAAVKFQSVYRMYIQRSRFVRKLTAVRFIESWYVALKMSQQRRQHFLAVNRAASTIQRIYHTYKLRQDISDRVKHLVVRTKAVRVIEVVYLSYVIAKRDRDKFLALKRSTVLMQRIIRCNIQARKEKRRNDAALLIQTTFRVFLQKKREKALMAARKIVVDEFVHAARSCMVVLRIQRWYRRTIIQRAERFQQRREFAALTIQSQWKGYLVRRKIKDARLKEVRERIEAANKKVTESMKLCNRTRSALDYLLKVKNLSTVYEALQQLDTSTTLSFRCCQRLVEDNALPVIFRIINYGNRSLPWISIKQVAFSILLNLAKCQLTYRAVYEEKDSMEFLIEQMSNFRDKKAAIFPMACNLLTVLAYDDDIKQDMQSRPKILSKFTSFYKMSERKLKMDSKRKQSLRVKQEKEQPYSKTAWHRRASTVNSKDPHTAIQMLIRRLELTV